MGRECPAGAAAALILVKHCLAGDPIQSRAAPLDRQPPNSISRGNIMYRALALNLLATTVSTAPAYAEQRDPLTRLPGLLVAPNKASGGKLGSARCREGGVKYV